MELDSANMLLNPKMMLVDSHCHLHMLERGPHLAIEKAAENHVGRMLSVAVALSDLPEILRIAEQHPEVDASVGLHPNEIVDDEPSVETLVRLATHPKVVAIGETGLDYYRDSLDSELQKKRFRTHIQASIEVNKPLIVHSRFAREDTITLLQEEKVSGVLHCFTENWEMAKKALDLGFYISISGIVTFKNAVELQEVVKKIPLDALLIETDSPYLAPVPYRGKSNEPAWVLHVAEKIGELKNISLEEIAQTTTQNYFRLFHSK